MRRTQIGKGLLAQYLRDDICQRPVNRDNGNPYHFTSSCRQWWNAEEIDEHVIIQDLDANISVQSSSDESAEEGHDVADSLPGVNGYPFKGWIDGILSLVSVEEAPVEDIHDVDEALSTYHAFPKITWSLHLRHEFDEYHGSAVGINCLHQTIEGAGKAPGVRREAGKMHDGWEGASSVITLGDEIAAERLTRGSLDGGI